MLTAHVLRSAKAYAALLFLVLSSVVAALPDVPLWLTVVTVAVGAVATYAVPNIETVEDESDPENPIITELDPRDDVAEH